MQLVPRPFGATPASFCPAMCFAVLFSLCSAARGYQEAEIDIARPAEGEFVIDQAALISEESRKSIEAISQRLLSEMAVPIVVVTIPSMADFTSDRMSIETFARLLFDQWGIGYARLENKSWNYGILLLISSGDRRARIELGNDWGRDKDRICQQIMDRQIVPQFRLGNFSAGALAGVTALDQMARGLEVPKTSTAGSPAGIWFVRLAAIGLVVFTVVSLVRRGKRGWAWVFWGGAFTVLTLIVWHLATQSHKRGGGGHFGGGSFGGGSSGGGGASGGW